MYGISLILSALCLLCVYECTSIYGGAGGLSGGFDGGSGGGFSGHGEEHHESPKPYAFGYAVKDFKKGTNFNQHEDSDGHYVKGSYEVALPDGRMQIVSYHADWKNGYHADVKYVGEAHHPEIYNTGHEAGGYGGGFAGGDSSSGHFQSLGSSGHHGGGYRK